MTGKRYYLTTLGAWQRHVAHFATSHWVALGPPSVNTAEAPLAAENDVQEVAQAAAQEISSRAPDATPSAAPSQATDVQILVLIEADEGVHLALEDDATFEALPHPLAQKSISGAAQAALSAYGIAPGATTFDAAEALARVHPLLRHRVF